MSGVKAPRKKSRKGASALFIPAGLLIGMVIGNATDNLVSDMVTGLGTGMVLFALVMILVRD